MMNLAQKIAFGTAIPFMVLTLAAVVMMNFSGGVLVCPLKVSSSSGVPLEIHGFILGLSFIIIGVLEYGLFGRRSQAEHRHIA